MVRDICSQIWTGGKGVYLLQEMDTARICCTLQRCVFNDKDPIINTWVV